MTPRLISLRDGAKYLGLKSHATLYAIAMRGEIAYVEIPSSGGRRRGRVLFDVSDLDAFVDKHKRGGQ